MNKGLLKLALLTAVCASMPVVMPSCSDYDDDISNLQQQIDGIKVDVDKLSSLIAQGNVITGVDKTSEGITFTLSNGQSYTITNGKDGAAGQNGANGTVWTIGSDGYWYKDGAKTEYKAIGVDGAVGAKGDKGDQGEQGEKGETGAAGANGQYYVPNPETGNFDIYQDGEFVKDSGISWRTTASGAITAVYSGNKLVLSGVKDADGKDVPVEIQIGTPVGSVAFIPSVMSQDVAYPTTDKPFYHLASYLDETKYNTSTKQFIPQTGWDKSNIVALEYRVSPQDAYIPQEAQATFINRVVTSRAVGDLNTLLNVESFQVSNGELLVNASFNHRAATDNQTQNDIAAMQLWNGQVPFTTDYIGATSDAIDAVIVNRKATTATSVARLYDRNYVINSSIQESDALVKQCVPLSDMSKVIALQYDQTLDLSGIVDLYSIQESAYLKDLDFSGISFTFSQPKEYLSNDAQKTNQQWFADLNGSIVSANAANLSTGLTPAIGRTPVFRCDAFIVDNAGTSRLVASAYIKIQFVEKAAQPGQEQTPLTYSMQQQQYEYHSLSASHTLVGQMDWRDVNTQIYGRPGLHSTNFWDVYGGSTDEYNVKVTTTKKDNSTYVISTGSAFADHTYTIATDGIYAEVTLGSDNTTTSNIKFEIDNNIKSENSYKDGGKYGTAGMGAEYIVTITIPSDNKYSRGDVVVEQIFYVREDCKQYNFNENYYYGSFTWNNSSYTDCVITKGTANGTTPGTWKLEVCISEVFKMISGQDIFSYYNTINNVTGIDFKCLNTIDGFAYDPTTHYVYLTSELTDRYKVAKMQYTVTLVNGETCVFYFNVIFQNPFVDGGASTLTLNANGIGAVTLETMPSVNVDDVNGKDICNGNSAHQLVLSALAKNGYKLTDSMVSVAFSFKKTTAYTDFTSQLAPNAVFDIDPATGVITYDNLGATLVPSYNLTVIAKVTFEDLSVVSCEIPVKIQGLNN